MPRPRTISDTELLNAAANIIAKKPADWTLNDITALTGLSPAAIFVRFGSKRNLHLQVVKMFSERGFKAVPVSNRHQYGIRTAMRLAAMSNDTELSELATGSAR